MNLRLDPILSIMGLGGVELVLVVATVMFAFVVFVGGAVLVVYFLTRQKRESKPPPPPAGAPGGGAAARPASTHCPQCGAKLPAGAPEGLCPACLLKRGMATDGGRGGAAGTVRRRRNWRSWPQNFRNWKSLNSWAAGGMGAVYKARQPALDRFVALKILPPRIADSPGFAERFNREARALARLVHPNIVAVHDFGRAGGLYYLHHGICGRRESAAGGCGPEHWRPTGAGDRAADLRGAAIRARRGHRPSRHQTGEHPAGQARAA